MPGNQVQELCRTLNARRRELQMTFAILAERSRVSIPTVTRTLTGHNPNVSLENVAAIADALGMNVEIVPRVSVLDLREEQARRKARQLSGIVQGTQGLESQAVSHIELNDIVRGTVHQLLSGPARKLWSE
jgi:transcriptional regulator with XRE-family HTH domain